MNHKFLILLTYYDRPEFVKDTLRSIIRANQFYQGWELAFIDDGSAIPGKPICDKIFKNTPNVVRHYNSQMTPEMKKLCGGSFIGYYLNKAIDDSNADIAILIGDDDQIYSDYLCNLNEYFLKYPECLSCYCNVSVYDPLTEKACDVHRVYSEDPNWKGHVWFGKSIKCAYKVDGIQVAWKLKCNKVFGARFKYPTSINHDALYFEELNERCDETPYCGFIGMYKGRHDGQLINQVKKSGKYFGETGTIDKKKGIILS